MSSQPLSSIIPHMAGFFMKRPSALVVLCATVVLSVFIARGDLRIQTASGDRSRVAQLEDGPQNGSRKNGPGARLVESPADEPTVVRAQAPARPRNVEMVVVHGRVLDALGFAVDAAKVSVLAGAKQAAAEKSAAEVQTDTEGRFELVLPQAAFADLRVHAAGNTPRWLRASLTSPDPLVIQLEPEAPWDIEPVVAQAPPLVGEGSVRDDAGVPLAGAFVTAVGSGLWSRTDEIGRYSLPLYGPNARLLVHETAGDHARAARSELVAFEREHGLVPLPELRTAPAGVIRGQLHDVQGAPLEGVPVVIRGEGVRRVCETGTSGRFLVAGLLNGTYEIRPHPWSGSVGRAQEVVLDGAVAECELSLEPVQSRKLQITNESGSPVGKAYVAVLLDGTRSGVTRADEQGWAEVGLASGPVQFEVRGEDGASEYTVRGLDNEQTRLVVAAP